MKLYLNSHNLSEIQEIFDWGVLDGVTLNPALLSTYRGDFVPHVKNICKQVDLPVFAQVVSATREAIVEEALRIRDLGDKMVVKIHTNAEGVAAIAKLKREHEIRICATAVHSTIESMVVARAGADHVAVFTGWLGEIDEHPTQDMVASIRTILDNAGFDTQILLAARSIAQIVQGFEAGAHEMTCGYPIWKQFLTNRFTTERWNVFSSEWKAVYGERTWITG